MLADKAYSHPSTRRALRDRRIRLVSPERTDQIARRRAAGSRGGRPPAFDASLYKQRNVIERCPEAATSPGRLFCHVYGRGKGQAQMIPGWPYSVVAALEPGRTSWTAVLDAVRLGPDDDDVAVTAAQVRDVITRLIDAGQWNEGDPAIWVIFDVGYDLTRLAWLLADLPARVLGRLRSDRVMQLSAPARQPHTKGRPRKHGGELALTDPATWPDPHVTTHTLTSRYGTAAAAAWDRVHARLTHRGAWLDHDGSLPVIDGTLIRLQVDHLPGNREPKPAWLWWSGTGALPAEVDRCWQAFLRRFDLEHTPPTCACPGNGPYRPAGSLRPGSAADLGTSAPPWPAQPGRQNQENPAPDALPARRTPPRTPPRRRENHQTRAQPQSQTRTRRLNDKLGAGKSCCHGGMCGH